MNLFHQSNYKSALKRALEDRKRRGRKINLSKLADACHVQKTYLSRVLNRDGHFSADQLHLACSFLGLNRRETKYISLLYDAERSNLAERKETLLREAKKLQSKAQNTENYIATDTFENKPLHYLQYHLNPSLQLIHLFLTIPRYAKNPDLIGEKLSLSKSQMNQYLDQLVRLKLVSYADEKWRVEREMVHLPRDSEIYPYYRLLSRTKALEKLQTTYNPNDYSFSAFFSANEKTRNLVREKFMEFLSTITLLIKKAEPTDIYQLGFDLLGWSEG